MIILMNFSVFLAIVLGTCFTHPFVSDYASVNEEDTGKKPKKYIAFSTDAEAYFIPRDIDEFSLHVHYKWFIMDDADDFKSFKIVERLLSTCIYLDEDEEAILSAINQRLRSHDYAIIGSHDYREAVPVHMTGAIEYLNAHYDVEYVTIDRIGELVRSGKISNDW